MKMWNTAQINAELNNFVQSTSSGAKRSNVHLFKICGQQKLFSGESKWRVYLLKTDT